MLNENLAKIRKAHGLTQEALAVKLNVVRQTVSKWEKGTAVPDADTLCRIADALDVSVSDLLGQPNREDKTDMARITECLTEINEQLAVRNRRSSRVLKIVCGIIAGFVVLTAVLMILNIMLFQVNTATKTDSVEVVQAEESYYSRDIVRPYAQRPDGTFEADGYTYKYRLEICGRLPNASAESTFVYLSNLPNIPFEQAWKAAGFSSNTADYFDVKEAVLVEQQITK